jgi:hypothetical protein
MPKRGGWWVKAAANRVTPAAGRPPGLLAHDKTAQVRSGHTGSGSRSGQIPTRLFQRKQKKPASAPPAMPGRPPRLKTVVPDQNFPTGSLLDRVRRDPTIRTEPSTTEAGTQPRWRKIRPLGESHPVILRNPRTNSKQNLLAIDDFSKNSWHLVNIWSGHRSDVEGNPLPFMQTGPLCARCPEVSGTDWRRHRRRRPCRES